MSPRSSRTYFQGHSTLQRAWLLAAATSLMAAMVSLVAPNRSALAAKPPIAAPTQAVGYQSGQSPQQLSYPPGTTHWILNYTLALAMGLTLLVAWNRLVNQRRERQSGTSLAKEAAKLKKLSIGYPEGMRIFEELRCQKLLEERFKGLGLSIHWRAYPSASSLLNGLSQGWIDFCGGGATASIFSQAAHHLFVRVAREKYPDLDADLILVPEDSAIHQLQELKGKRIAFDEGSSAHYLLVRCLEAAGVEYGQIEPVHLAQQDALPLFRKELVDAWVVWMPYAATEARRQYPGRSLGSLESLLGSEVGREVHTLYYTIPELVRDYPRILKAILEEVNEAGILSLEKRLVELRELLDTGEETQADQQHLQLSIQQLETRIRERALVPLDDFTLQHLQEQANRFYRLRIISERINVSDVSHTLRTRQNWSY